MTGENENLVSIVVPVYRGAESITELVERVIRVFRDLEEDCEIILVNDGSPDDSWNVITRLAQAHRQVTGLNLLRNFGQHNALLAGIRSANGSITVTMDDDLQNPPEEIPRLLDGVRSGHAVVYGVPDKQRHGIFRDFASTFVKFALRVGLGYSHASETSAFRAFRTQIRDAFDRFSAKFVSIDVLLTWGTSDFHSVTVQHLDRGQGRSGYTFGRLLDHTINIVTSFSSLPLKIASLVGFLFTVFGLVVLAYSLAMYVISGRAVPGFTFLASIIAVFSGVQLFSLGIIGEYIGRIHQKALNQPCYVIESTTEASSGT